MTFTESLLIVCRAYSEALAIPMKTASSRVFDESKLLDAVLSGRATLTLARADKALRWLSDHWPDGAVWPREVARPAPDRPTPVSGQPDSDFCSTQHLV